MKVELNLPYLLRYGYGGFLAVLYTAVLAPELLEQTLTALGGAVAIFAVICIGACVYVVDRYVLGEMLVYWALYWVHRFIDSVWKRRTGLHTTDAQHYLLEFARTKNIACTRMQARTAYVLAVRHLLGESEKAEAQLAHGELHIVWLTFYETLGAWLYVLFARPEGLDQRVFLSVACCFFFVGLVTDIRQHKIEATYIKRLENHGEKLIGLLRSVCE